MAKKSFIDFFGSNLKFSTDANREFGNAVTNYFEDLEAAGAIRDPLLRDWNEDVGKRGLLTERAEVRVTGTRILDAGEEPFDLVLSRTARTYAGNVNYSRLAVGKPELRPESPWLMGDEIGSTWIPASEYSTANAQTAVGGLYTQDLTGIKPPSRWDPQRTTIFKNSRLLADSDLENWENRNLKGVVKNLAAVGNAFLKNDYYLGPRAENPEGNVVKAARNYSISVVDGPGVLPKINFGIDVYNPKTESYTRRSIDFDLVGDVAEGRLQNGQRVSVFASSSGEQLDSAIMQLKSIAMPDVLKQNARDKFSDPFGDVEFRMAARNRAEGRKARQEEINSMRGFENVRFGLKDRNQLTHVDMLSLAGTKSGIAEKVMTLMGREGLLTPPAQAAYDRFKKTTMVPFSHDDYARMDYALKQWQGMAWSNSQERRSGQPGKVIMASDMARVLRDFDDVRAIGDEKGRNLQESQRVYDRAKMHLDAIRNTGEQSGDVLRASQILDAQAAQRRSYADIARDLESRSVYGGGGGGGGGTVDAGEGTVQYPIVKYNPAVAQRAAQSQRGVAPYNVLPSSGETYITPNRQGGQDMAKQELFDAMQSMTINQSREAFPGAPHWVHDPSLYTGSAPYEDALYDFFMGAGQGAPPQPGQSAQQGQPSQAGQTGQTSQTGASSTFQQAQQSWQNRRQNAAGQQTATGGGAVGGGGGAVGGGGGNAGGGGGGGGGGGNYNQAAGNYGYQGAGPHRQAYNRNNQWGGTSPQARFAAVLLNAMGDYTDQMSSKKWEQEQRFRRAELAANISDETMEVMLGNRQSTFAGAEHGFAKEIQVLRENTVALAKVMGDTSKNLDPLGKEFKNAQTAMREHVEMFNKLNKELGEYGKAIVGKQETNDELLAEGKITRAQHAARKAQVDEYYRDWAAASDEFASKSVEDPYTGERLTMADAKERLEGKLRMSAGQRAAYKNEPGWLGRFRRWKEGFDDVGGMFYGGLGALGFTLFNIQRANRFTFGALSQMGQEYASAEQTLAQTGFELGGGMQINPALQNLILQGSAQSQFRQRMGESYATQVSPWVTNMLSGLNNLSDSQINAMTTGTMALGAGLIGQLGFTGAAALTGISGIAKIGPMAMLGTIGSRTITNAGLGYAAGIAGGGGAMAGLGGALAGGASVLGPIALAAAGIGGTWISNRDMRQELASPYPTREQEMTADVEARYGRGALEDMYGDNVFTTIVNSTGGAISRAVGNAFVEVQQYASRIGWIDDETRKIRDQMNAGGNQGRMVANQVAAAGGVRELAKQRFENYLGTEQGYYKFGDANTPVPDAVKDKYTPMTQTEQMQQNAVAALSDKFSDVSQMYAVQQNVAQLLGKEPSRGQLRAFANRVLGSGGDASGSMDTINKVASAFGILPGTPEMEQLYNRMTGGDNPEGIGGLTSVGMARWGAAAQIVGPQATSSGLSFGDTSVQQDMATIRDWLMKGATPEQAATSYQSWYGKSYAYQAVGLGYGNGVDAYAPLMQQYLGVNVNPEAMAQFSQSLQFVNPIAEAAMMSESERFAMAQANLDMIGGKTPLPAWQRQLALKQQQGVAGFASMFGITNPVAQAAFEMRIPTTDRGFQQALQSMTNIAGMGNLSGDNKGELAMLAAADKSGVPRRLLDLAMSGQTAASYGLAANPQIRAAMMNMPGLSTVDRRLMDNNFQAYVGLSGVPLNMYNEWSAPGDPAGTVRAPMADYHDAQAINDARRGEVGQRLSAYNAGWQVRNITREYGGGGADSVGLAQQEYDIRRKMGIESLDFQKRSLEIQRAQLSLAKEEYGVKREYALQEREAGRGQSLLQRQYFYEDLSKNIARSEITNEYNLDETNRQIRFASGRERFALMRRRDYMVTQQNWQRDDFSTQRRRADQAYAYEDERYTKAVEYELKLNDLQQRRFALQDQALSLQEEQLNAQIGHQEELREIEDKRFADTVEYNKGQIGMLGEVAALERERAALETSRLDDVIANIVAQRNFYEGFTKFLDSFDWSALPRRTGGSGDGSSSSDGLPTPPVPIGVNPVVPPKPRKEVGTGPDDKYENESLSAGTGVSVLNVYIDGQRLAQSTWYTDAHRLAHQTDGKL